MGYGGRELTRHLPHFPIGRDSVLQIEDGAAIRIPVVECYDWLLIINRRIDWSTHRQDR